MLPRSPPGCTGCDPRRRAVPRSCARTGHQLRRDPGRSRSGHRTPGTGSRSRNSHSSLHQALPSQPTHPRRRAPPVQFRPRRHRVLPVPPPEVARSLDASRSHQAARLPRWLALALALPLAHPCFPFTLPPRNEVTSSQGGNCSPSHPVTVRSLDLRSGTPRVPVSLGNPHPSAGPPWSTPLTGPLGARCSDQLPSLGSPLTPGCPIRCDARRLAFQPHRSGRGPIDRFAVPYTPPVARTSVRRSRGGQGECPSPGAGRSRSLSGPWCCRGSSTRDRSTEQVVLPSRYNRTSVRSSFAYVIASPSLADQAHHRWLRASFGLCQLLPTSNRWQRRILGTVQQMVDGHCRPGRGFQAEPASPQVRCGTERYWTGTEQFRDHSVRPGVA